MIDIHKLRQQVNSGDLEGALVHLASAGEKALDEVNALASLAYALQGELAKAGEIDLAPKK